MEEVKLEFISPAKLDELQDGESVNKEVWVYDGIESGELTLNIDNWIISCEANNESKSIDQWLVNEETHTMKVGTQGEATGGFKMLDYQFAVSMIGQLCEAKDLVTYLQSLQDVFKVGRRQGESNETNRKTE